jgi:hypothetical protein
MNGAVAISEASACGPTMAMAIRDSWRCFGRCMSTGASRVCVDQFVVVCCCCPSMRITSLPSLCVFSNLHVVLPGGSRATHLRLLLNLENL